MKEENKVVRRIAERQGDTMVALKGRTLKPLAEEMKAIGKDAKDYAISYNIEIEFANCSNDKIMLHAAERVLVLTAPELRKRGNEYVQSLEGTTIKIDANTYPKPHASGDPVAKLVSGLRAAVAGGLITQIQMDNMVAEASPSA